MLTGVVRPYGDATSRGTPPAIVDAEMACQRSMQERARRLAQAVARGLITPAMQSDA